MASIDRIGSNKANGYEPEPVATAEAVRVINKHVKEQGQQEFPFGDEEE